MEMFEVRKEIRKIDDNVGRNIESLDLSPLPTVTEWYRKRIERKQRLILFL
jgi:hypothetical protein